MEISHHLRYDKNRIGFDIELEYEDYGYCITSVDSDIDGNTKREVFLK